MSAEWPQVTLGEVLSKSNESTDIQAHAMYLEVTVRMWGKGVVLRRQALGAEIAAPKRSIVRKGQFILSRIDARNGAFGLIPEFLDGAVVSNDFPTFQLRKERLDPKFLDWLSKTASFVELCKASSEGSTNRVRLKEEKFLTTTISLPPLAEQQRIVARIEELATKIEEACRLRRLAVVETMALLSSETSRVFEILQQKYPTKHFGTFNPHVTSGPRNWGKNYDESSGYRFYRAQDIGPQGEVLSSSKVYVAPPSGEQGRTASLLPGDLMLVITGATVGRCTVFRDGLEKGFVSQHVAICRLPQDQLLSDYVLRGLRAPQGQEQLLSQIYGQGKPGLNLSNIRALSLPIPPFSEQLRIVAYLDNLQAKVDTLKRLQAETTAELNAMLPSILDKAFKGTL